MEQKLIDSLGDRRLPRYIRLAEEIKRAITSGELGKGEKIPSETQLAKTYAVSSGTARQAVSYLVDYRLLERRQGSGTFVAGFSLDQSLLRFFRFRGDDEDYILPESRILNITLANASAEVATRLNINDGQSVIQMSRLRLLDGEPVLAEEIWLDADKFSGFESLTENEIGPLLYPLYERQFDLVVASAKEALRVEDVSAAYSRLLRIPARKSVVVIERVAFGYDGVPIEWRRSYGRADHFTYQIEIT